MWVYSSPLPKLCATWSHLLPGPLPGYITIPNIVWTLHTVPSAQSSTRPSTSHTPGIGDLIPHTLLWWCPVPTRHSCFSPQKYYRYCTAVSCRSCSHRERLTTPRPLHHLLLMPAASIPACQRQHKSLDLEGTAFPPPTENAGHL
jgi:hypothetical protein